MIPFVDSVCSLRSGVAPRFRLTKQKCANIECPVFLALGQWGQVFFLLFVRTERIQSPANQAIVYAHAYTNACIDLADLLHCQHITDRIESRTTIFRIN